MYANPGSHVIAVSAFHKNPTKPTPLLFSPDNNWIIEWYSLFAQTRLKHTENYRSRIELYDPSYLMGAELFLPTSKSTNTRLHVLLLTTPNIKLQASITPNNYFIVMLAALCLELNKI